MIVGGLEAQLDVMDELLLRKAGLRDEEEPAHGPQLLQVKLVEAGLDRHGLFVIVFICLKNIKKLME